MITSSRQKHKKQCTAEMLLLLIGCLAAAGNSSAQPIIESNSWFQVPLEPGERLLDFDVTGLGIHMLIGSNGKLLSRRLAFDGQILSGTELKDLGPHSVQLSTLSDGTFAVLCRMCKREATKVAVYSADGKPLAIGEFKGQIYEVRLINGRSLIGASSTGVFAGSMTEDGRIEWQRLAALDFQHPLSVWQDRDVVAVFDYTSAKIFRYDLRSEQSRLVQMELGGYAKIRPPENGTYYPVVYSGAPFGDGSFMAFTNLIDHMKGATSLKVDVSGAILEVRKIQLPMIPVLQSVTHGQGHFVPKQVRLHRNKLFCLSTAGSVMVNYQYK